MYLSELLNENRNIDWPNVHAIGQHHYQGTLDADETIKYFQMLGLSKKEAKKYQELAKQGHPSGIGEKGLIPGGQLPLIGDILNPINLGLTLGGGGVAGLGAKKVGGNILKHGFKQGLKQSATQAALAVVKNPANLAKAKAYARKYPTFFNPKALKRMDKARTIKFKRKIAQLTKENRIAMRNLEHVKSFTAQSFGASTSVARQYIASLVWLGGFIGNDVIKWAQDPDATVGDLAAKVGEQSLWEAAFILGVPVTKIIGLAAKKPATSLWNLIKSLYSKYGNAGKVAGTLAGLSATSAVTGSANVTQESVNEVFGLGGQKRKQAVLAFGRLNPATVGHELMVEAIKQQPGDSFLFLSDRAAKLPTDPLSPQEKLDWARLSFNGIAVGLAKTALLAVDRLYKMGYTDIIFVEGEDKLFPIIERYNDVETKVHHYKFNSIKQHRLTRNPDADDATGMSASKMRQAVLDNDFETFKSGVTQSAQPQAQAMFEKLGQLLGANNEN